MINKHDNNFLDWLVGFSEGDGSFVMPQSASSKKHFEICQSVKDMQVLYYIKENLGFGIVKSNEKAGKFVVYKKKQLEELKTLFAGRICTENTLHRYARFYEQSSIIQKQKPSLDNAWLSGFIDAEGCFRVKDDNSVKLIFEITQKDEHVIRGIRDLFKSLKGNIREDRGVWRLEFSQKEARIELERYLRIYPLKSHKRIVLDKWIKARRYAEENENEKAIKIGQVLNKWRKEN